MYRIRALRTNEEREIFVKGFEASFKIRNRKKAETIETEEVQSFDFVYGIFNKDRMVGGFVLNHYPQRCFQGMTRNERFKILHTLGGAEEACELVCVWKNPRESQQRLRLFLWSQIILKTLELQRTYIFGNNTSEKTGKKLYYTVAPVFVREAGKNGDRDLFYFTRSIFVLNFMANFVKFSAKLPGKAAAKKRGNHAYGGLQQPI